MSTMPQWIRTVDGTLISLNHVSSIYGRTDWAIRAKCDGETYILAQFSSPLAMETAIQILMERLPISILSMTPDVLSPEAWQEARTSEFLAETPETQRTGEAVFSYCGYCRGTGHAYGNPDESGNYGACVFCSGTGLVPQEAAIGQEKP